MQPKLYAIGIYQGTQTLLNMRAQHTAVLQLLGRNNIGCVRTLGMKSGKNYDKHSWLRKRSLTCPWNDFEVLKEAAAWILLNKLESKKQGDHVLHVFEVTAYQANHDQILMLDHLREKKLIRI